MELSRNYQPLAVTGSQVPVPQVIIIIIIMSDGLGFTIFSSRIEAGSKGMLVSTLLLEEYLQPRQLNADHIIPLLEIGPLDLYARDAHPDPPKTDLFHLLLSFRPNAYY